MIIVLCVIAYLFEVGIGHSFSPSIPALLKAGASNGTLIFSGRW